ncbi:hypothetical protein, partial [Pseudomonas syringae group genomosp. 7]|uniref:hypothetical protein n=1 Tax=Pseudomonas syringae group genomosp. 7 TaxID=251699 RepID=UPI00377062F5
IDDNQVDLACGVHIYRRCQHYIQPDLFSVLKISEIRVIAGDRPASLAKRDHKATGLTSDIQQATTHRHVIAQALIQLMTT